MVLRVTIARSPSSDRKLCTANPSCRPNSSLGSPSLARRDPIIDATPPVTGDVDLDGHAPDGGSIEALNGGFGFRLGWHLHKTEPPRLTSSPVGDEIDSGDL